MTAPSHPARAILTFSGQLDLPDFVQWAHHRATKLGLSGTVTVQGADVVADVEGPPELIDAMALCCSLGPASSWVEQVGRREAEPHRSGATGCRVTVAD